MAILHIHIGEGMVTDLTFDLRTFTNVVEEAADLLLAMRWEVADWAVVACESEEAVHLISTQGTVSPRRRALCGRRPTREDTWEAEPLDDPEAWDMDALCRACVVRYRMQAVAKVSVLRGGDA